MTNEEKKRRKHEYYERHKDKAKAQIRDWQARNPDKVKEYNHRQYLRRKALKNGSGGVSGGKDGEGGDTA